MQDPQRQTERDRVRAMPLAQIDSAKGGLFEHELVDLHFEHLRSENPVHLSPSKRYGPYWSVTRYQDIMAVDTNPAAFSSDAHRGGITLAERPAGEVLPSFIAMDKPRHGQQRKTVSPIVAPANLALLEGTIRQRAAAILDGLPIGEEFDWVQRVSIELTTQMLAHSPATRDMGSDEYLGNVILLIVERKRHHTQFHQRWAAGAEPAFGRIRQAARQPGAGGQHGARDHPLRLRGV